MKLFKQSFNIFKENFFTLLLSQTVLFFASLFFLVFVKGKVQSYLEELQQFQPMINTLMATLDKADPATIMQTQSVITSMSHLTDQVLIFAFIVTPIILLLKWILFQGIFWNTIKKHKATNFSHYIIKLAIPTVIILSATVAYTTSQQTMVEFFSSFDTNLSLIFLVLFTSLYFLTMFYLILNNQSFTKAIKQTVTIAIKKIYKYAPLYMPLFANTLLLIYLLMVTLIQNKETGFFSVSTIFWRIIL